jgi:hypothetical protein
MLHRAPHEGATFRDVCYCNFKLKRELWPSQEQWDVLGNGSLSPRIYAFATLIPDRQPCPKASFVLCATCSETVDGA